MVNYSTEQFQYGKADIINYGQLFINSEGGQNWEKLWKGSSKSPIKPFWLHFYYDLKTNKFQDLIESLFNYKIGAYQREKIIQEIKDLIEKIKVTETLNPKDPTLKTCISIGSETLVKFKEDIEFLFENYILENYPLGEGEKNDLVILKLINGKFKEILLDGYYFIINHYENEDRQRINELENQVQNLQNTIQTLKGDTKSNEYRLSELKAKNRKYKDESNRWKILQKKDQETIEELTREVKKLKEENDMVYILDDDLPDSTHNDLFALILLNELDILDSKVWANAESIEDIANVLFNLLKISKKSKLTANSIVKYRGIILHPSTDHKRYEGWQKTYNKRLTEIMKKYLPKKEIKLFKPIKLK